MATYFSQFWRRLFGRPATNTPEPKPEFLYRFRSIDALLGERQELQKQEIYFPGPDELNDPMEGFKDLFWQGDEIVWRNLLRHYLLCLTQSLGAALMLGTDYLPVISRGFVFTTRLSLPTQQFRTIYQRICATFFATHRLDELPALLAGRPHPFRRDDLEFCLRGLHGIALSCILRILREENLFPPARPGLSPPPISEEVVAGNLTKVLNALKESRGAVSAEALRDVFIAAGHIYMQVDLIKYLGETNPLARAWHSIFYSFPGHYVDSLKDLIYFDWYAACFVSNPSHAAMWGNYSDGHKGVCLKFHAKTNGGGSPTLSLHGISGARASRQGSEPIYGDIAMQFDKVTYTDKLAEIDFFRSIGRVPADALRSEWYTDDQGKVSHCADAVLAENDDWRQRYWSSFRTMATTKLQDWWHEDEYRLLLTSPLGSFQEKRNRKLTYRFSDLAGIIFGIKTSLEDKARLFDIVADKCKQEGRPTFEFSQATYVPHSGKIETRPLDLLTFGHSQNAEMM